MAETKPAQTSSDRLFNFSIKKILIWGSLGIINVIILSAVGSYRNSSTRQQTSADEAARHPAYYTTKHCGGAGYGKPYDALLNHEFHAGETFSIDLATGCFAMYQLPGNWHYRAYFLNPQPGDGVAPWCEDNEHPPPGVFLPSDEDNLLKMIDQCKTRGTMYGLPVPINGSVLNLRLEGHGILTIEAYKPTTLYG